MKKYIKNIVVLLLEFFVVTIFLSLLSYFNLISESIYSYLEFILLFFILYINGKKASRSSSKFSILEGLKIGLLFVLIFIIYNIIFGNDFGLKQFIYYLLILLTPTLGSFRKNIKDWLFSLSFIYSF